MNPDPRHSTEPEDDWSREAARWRDVEIRRLEALLSQGSTGQQGQPGGSGGSDPIGPLIQGLLETQDAGGSMRRLFEALLKNDRLVEAIAEVEGASAFGSILELARQRRGAKALHAVINNPVSVEEDLKTILALEWWVFGGRYIPASRREGIPVLELVDLPLITTDRRIHVVVIGPANVADLVVGTAGAYRVGPLVEELVNRAINQLRAVDNQRDTLRAQLGLETRRAYGTVVVGHPAYAQRLPGNELRDTIRTYGSHLNHLELMTDEQLLENAQQSLDLVEGS